MGLTAAMLAEKIGVDVALVEKALQHDTCNSMNTVLMLLCRELDIDWRALGFKRFE